MPTPPETKHTPAVQTWSNRPAEPAWMKEVREIAEEEYAHHRERNFDADGNELYPAVGESSVWLTVHWLIREYDRLSSYCDSISDPVQATSSARATGAQP